MITNNDKYIQSVDEFIQFINEYNFDDIQNRPITAVPTVREPTIIFRGHSELSYKLESTLERQLLKVSTSEELFEKRTAYEHILDEYLDICKKLFKGRIAEQYILLDESYENEIWALGQHYGLITPLLDWTESFLVALYFAFEPIKENNKYRVIYRLNMTDINDDELSIFVPKIDIGGRITAQRGLFTKRRYTLLEDFSKKIEVTKNGQNKKIEPPLTKIIIADELRSPILNYLFKINICGVTLFPDIQGAIRDMNFNLINGFVKKEELWIKPKKENNI